MRNFLSKKEMLLVILVFMKIVKNYINDLIVIFLILIIKLAVIKILKKF